MSDKHLKRPKRKVMRVDRSPMNAKQWCLELECGHEVWVTRASRPSLQEAECERCTPESSK